MVGLIIVVVLIIIAIGVIKSLMATAIGLVGLAITILSWMFVGYLAGKLLRGRGYGPLGDTALGLGGGIVGTILLSVLSLGGVGHIPLVGGILVGVVGAVALVFVIRLFGNEDFAR